MEDWSLYLYGSFDLLFNYSIPKVDMGGWHLWKLKTLNLGWIRGNITFYSSYNLVKYIYLVIMDQLLGQVDFFKTKKMTRWFVSSLLFQYSVSG